MGARRAEANSRWPTTLPEARELQESLRKRVRLTPLSTRLRRVAGCDVSEDRAAGRVFAAVVVLSWPDLDRIEIATATRDARFPYVPGYLSFREGPLLDEAFARLSERPDLVMFDGQGIAHPRRCGLASHLGVLWDLPAVGCAKSRLVGDADEPGLSRGDWSSLVDRGELVGSVLRTRHGVKPMWVSPGHRIDHEGARRVVLEACTRFRLPETTRRAHLEVNVLRRAWIARGRP